MTVSIQRLTGNDAYDLIFPDYLAKLSITDQITMHQAMVHSSRVWLGYAEGQVQCLWGIVSPTLLSDRAYLWLYTTPHLTHHVFLLVRHSQRVVQEMLKDFPTITGHCEVRATKSIRWLRWLGATFGEPQGRLVPFIIRAK